MFKSRPVVVALLLLCIVFGGLSSASASVPRLVGVSAGNGLRYVPNAKVVRVFQPRGPQTFAESGALRSVPAGAVTIVSFTQVPTAARWKAVLADWDRSHRRVWWVWQHEPDRPSLHITPARYQAVYKFLLDIWWPYRASSNVRSMTVMTGNVLRYGAEQWYVPRVDALGFDVYYLDNLPRVIAYARSKGKPLAIPEFGDAVGQKVSDAACVYFVQQYMKILDSSVVFAAAWFSGNGNDLSNKPRCSALLRSLAA